MSLIQATSHAAHHVTASLTALPLILDVRGIRCPDGDPENIEFTNLQDTNPAAMIFERGRIFTPVAPSWIAHTIRRRSSAVHQRPGTVTAVWLWCSISSSLKTASDVLPVQFLREHKTQILCLLKQTLAPSFNIQSQSLNFNEYQLRGKWESED